MGYGFVSGTEIATLFFLCMGFLFLLLFLITWVVTESVAVAEKACSVLFVFMCAAIIFYILMKSINVNSHNGVPILLWAFWLFVIIYFLFINKRKLWVRGLIVSAVIAHIIFLIILPMREANRLAEAEKSAKIAIRRAFGEKAFAHFEKRCESSGFFIYKNVPKQDSVLIMNPRLKQPTRQELNNQYWMGDPYSRRALDHGAYVASFDTYLFPRHKCKVTPVLDKDGNEIMVEKSLGKSRLNTWEPLDFMPYFKFIEIPNQNNPQQMMRYIGVPTQEMVSVYFSPCTGDQPKYEYQGETITQTQSEYGYQSEDISTKEDRDLWIAGSRLKIIHLKTGQIVAERVGYLFDNSFGGNQYTPAWRNARQYCPGGDDNQFIIHVLSEKLERVEKDYKLINKLGEQHE